MDDLEALLSGLEAVQQKKSSVRLSDRNVVELVNKLKQLGLLGDDLLYTTNGKEYITRQRLEEEVRAAIDAAGGRVALVDLPSQLGVDLMHCERAAEAVVTASKGAVLAAQGELFSQAYFDGLAAEVEEMLQESGVVSLGDLARRFALSAELVTSALGSRVGKGIAGRLEGGVIYTPAHLARVKAQLRGALRGAAAPVSLASLARQLGLEGLGSLSALLPSLIEELAAAGAIAGRLAAGGTSWTPAVYVRSQQEAVRRFFQQNGYITYDTVAKYGVPSAKQFLQQAFPDGVALGSAYLAPAVVEQVAAATEEALSASTWCDVQTCLPSVLSGSDVAEVLSKVKAVSAATASGGALVLAGTCLVTTPFLSSLRGQLLELATKAAEEAHRQQKKAAAPASAAAEAAGAKAGGKKGGAAAAPAAADSDEDDDWDMGRGKGKKGGKGRKGKGGGGGAPAAKGGAGGSKAAGSSGKGKQGSLEQQAEASGRLLSAESLAERIVELQPELEAAGVDGELPQAIASELRPAVLQEYERALHAIFTAGAERRRRLREAAAAALDEAYPRLQACSHGAELFSSDEATLAVLHRHLLRTAATDCVDALLRYLAADEAASSEQEAEQEGGAEGSSTAAGPLSPADRSAILKKLQPDVKAPVTTAVDKLGGSSLEEFMTELHAAADAAGLRLRRLEKKGERAWVLGHRKTLEAQAAQAADPGNLLALVVPALLARHSGRAVSLPGRALAAAVDKLAGDLPKEQHQLLVDFHAAVVEHLRAQSDSSSSAQLAARLEEMAPRVRALLAGTEADE